MDVITLFNFAPGNRGSTLNASNLKVGGKYCAPKAGTITHIGVYCSNLLNPPTYEARVETLSSGVPSGTLWVAGATATFSPTTTDFVWLPLSTACTVAKNDEFAPVVQYSSGTIGTNNRTDVRFTVPNSLFGHPPGMSFNGTSWSAQGEASAVCARYSDGTILGVPMTTNGSYGLTNVSNPSEAGSVWTQPFTGTCLGLRGQIRVSSLTVLATINLYDSANTVLRTVTVPGTSLTGTSTNYTGYFYLDSPITLVRGRQYRIGMTVNGNGGILIYGDFLTAADKEIYAGSASATQRVGTGAWTDIPTRSVPFSPLMASAGRDLPLGEVFE